MQSLGDGACLDYDDTRLAYELPRMYSVHVRRDVCASAHTYVNALVFVAG